MQDEEETNMKLLASMIVLGLFFDSEDGGDMFLRNND
jgi:hypothetical protein